MGVEIFDPNSNDFPTPRPPSYAKFDHPAFRVPSAEDHPLYKSTKCDLFDGTEPFTDGIDQACALTKAVKRMEFPKTILQQALKIAQPKNLEQKLRELIMRGEKYDPALERLPKQFDPVIFWIRRPSLYGAPVMRKTNVILENLFRHIVLSAIQFDQLDFLRHDIDEPLSCTLSIEGRKSPLVVRSEPHIIVQAPQPIRLLADDAAVKATRQEKVPDVTPIDPRIDLTRDHVYNDDSVMPRMKFPLYMDTVIWGREQDQKYPWTREQNAANAVMLCFGAAASQAMRHGNSVSGVLKKPVVTRAIQLVNGMVDLVIFQLNTLDLNNKEDDVKNMVWIEHAQRLYKPKPYYENYDEVLDLNVETFHKVAGLLLTR